MDAGAAKLNVSRQGTEAVASPRSGLRLPTLLAVATLHVAGISALALLFPARRTPPPATEVIVPVVFMPAAVQPPDPSPQILASSTLPVPNREAPATLLPLPPLILPPGQAGSHPRPPPRKPHSDQIGATSASAPHPPADQAPQANIPVHATAVAHAVTATPAPATPAHDIVHALAGWEARIRQAVQDAVIYPASARLLHRDGSAQVRFDYDRGAIENASIIRTSHFGTLDNAALEAVTRAAIPDPPAELGPQKRTMLVWVQFRLLAEE